MVSSVIQAAFVKEAGGVELRKVDRPAVEEGSVVVEMKASGVCGTDLEKLSGENITSSILGHEVSGIISESRSDRFEVGEFVVPHHHVACGKCDLCMSGATTMCEQFRNSNFRPCGFAQEFLVPKYNVENGGVHTVPKGTISFEEASFAEPLACCLRAINLVLPRSESIRNALVVGAGPIGLLHMELMRSRFPGVKTVAVDISEKRLQFAEKFERADPLNAARVDGGKFSSIALQYIPQGFDLVIVATGSPNAFDEAIRCIRKRGKLLLFGAPYKGSVHALDLAAFFLNERTVTSSYSASEVEMRAALSMILQGQVDVKKFITAKYPLERIAEGMAAARSEEHVKVLITN